MALHAVHALELFYNLLVKVILKVNNVCCLAESSIRMTDTTDKRSCLDSQSYPAFSLQTTLHYLGIGISVDFVPYQTIERHIVLK